MRCAIATAIVVIFPCLATAQPADAVIPVELTEAQRDMVVSAVRKRLKDPESARFGVMAAARKDGKEGVDVCGMVNARNSYGGYTGEQPFIGTMFIDRPNGKPPIFIPLAIGGNKIAREATIKVCRDTTRINLF